MEYILMNYYYHTLFAGYHLNLQLKFIKLLKIMMMN